MVSSSANENCRICKNTRFLFILFLFLFVILFLASFVNAADPVCKECQTLDNYRLLWNEVKMTTKAQLEKLGNPPYINNAEVEIRNPDILGHKVTFTPTNTDVITIIPPAPDTGTDITINAQSTKKIRFQVQLTQIKCGTNFARVKITFPGAQYIWDVVIFICCDNEKLQPRPKECIDYTVKLPPGMGQEYDYAGFSKKCDPFSHAIIPNICQKDTFVCRFGKCRPLCQSVTNAFNEVITPAVETVADFGEFNRRANNKVEFSIQGMTGSEIQEILPEVCQAYDRLSNAMKEKIKKIIIADKEKFKQNVKRETFLNPRVIPYYLLLLIPGVFKSQAELIENIAEGSAGMYIKGKPGKIFLRGDAVLDFIRNGKKNAGLAPQQVMPHEVSHDLTDKLGDEFRKKWRAIAKIVYFSDKPNTGSPIMCLGGFNFKYINYNDYVPHEGLLHPYGGYHPDEDIGMFISYAYLISDRLESRDFFRRILNPQGDLYDSRYYEKFKLLYDRGFISKETWACIEKLRAGTI